MIIAIASWYYPNPDVATSNEIHEVTALAGSKNVTIDAALLKELLLMLKVQL